MITIITGAVDSGKTTELIRRWGSTGGQRDGFAVEKAYRRGCLIGQNLLHLQSGLCVPVTRREAFLPEGVEINLRYGGYAFLRRGLRMAVEITQGAIEGKARCFFADEFGPVELAGQGLWPAYQLLFDYVAGENADLVMVARESCLRQAMGCINDFLLNCRYRIVIMGPSGPLDGCLDEKG